MHTKGSVIAQHRKTEKTMEKNERLASNATSDATSNATSHVLLNMHHDNGVLVMIQIQTIAATIIVVEGMMIGDDHGLARSQKALRAATAPPITSILHSALFAPARASESNSPSLVRCHQLLHWMRESGPNKAHETAFRAPSDRVRRGNRRDPVSTWASVYCVWRQDSLKWLNQSEKESAFFKAQHTETV